MGRLVVLGLMMMISAIVPGRAAVIVDGAIPTEERGAAPENNAATPKEEEVGAAPEKTGKKRPFRPHIVVVVADDLGSDDVQSAGGTRDPAYAIETPHIDAWLERGVRLSNYYVQPSCSPTRATLLTGRYPLHHGLNSFIPPTSAFGLPVEETTLADVLKGAGYSTHAVGKWHCGFHREEHTPTFRGFDSFYGFWVGGEDYDTHVQQGAYDLRREDGPRCGADCTRVDDAALGAYSTTLFADEATRIVTSHDASNPQSPLFLYLAFQAVHAPDEAPARYVQPYESSIASDMRRTYAGMLAALDEGVGNVTDALAASGFLDDTLLFFTADNGGPSTTCAAQGSSNAPLRGSKCSIYEGGTKVTAFIAGAGVRAGATAPGLAHAADLLPTLSDALRLQKTSSSCASCAPGGSLPLDGVSFWADVRADDDDDDDATKAVASSVVRRTEIYYGVTDFQVGTWGPALRDADGWKLIVGSGGEDGSDVWDAAWNTTTNGSHQQMPLLLTPMPPGAMRPPSTDDCPPSAAQPRNLCGAMDNSTFLLYDLATDPEERANGTQTALEHPDIVAMLWARIQELWATGVPQLTDDPDCPPAFFGNDTVVGPTWVSWCTLAKQDSSPPRGIVTADRGLPR